jgi:hypothetical protein
VVRNRPAIEVAFCSAERTTLAGSTIPDLNMSVYSPVAAFRPWPGSRPRTFSTTTPPSRPALKAICLSGLLEGPADDERPGRLVTGQVDLGQGSWTRSRVHAAAGDDALLHRRAGVGDGVLDAVLLLLELDLGGRPDLDHANAPGQLGQPLLELLAVVVGVGVLDLGPDLVDRPLMSSGSPLPSTMVVSSLVTTTLRARPSRSRETFSSLSPTPRR